LIKYTELYSCDLDEVETLDEVDTDDDVDTELDVDTLERKFVVCHHKIFAWINL